MKNKKMISMIVAVTLIAVIGVGATLAYFTDKTDTTNVITMGHVDIEIDEPNYEGDENNEVKDITPGETIVKDPTITVQEGSADAFIRATLTLEGLTEEQAAALMEGIEINDGWYYNQTDKYYYYNTKLSAGQEATLFDEVTIPETWGNEVADLSFKIIINAEAIQADNFNPTMDGEYITGWNYTDGQPITAETYDKAASENIDNAGNADGENAE